MRKHIKKELYSIIGSLRKAHGYIKKNLNSSIQQMQFLLEECQNSAIEMGNVIEKYEGKGTKAVSNLEEYCEQIWNYTQAVTVEERRKVCKSMEDRITKAQNCITHDISEQYEVVFLPYKASMWDSLESVWLAARDDESCIAYVIPVPYYDRNSDGSLGKQHWEKDEFPNYVPITLYSQYNLKERHPDAIYIHNPYDGVNLVTCIHPDFFSKNIKNYTDLLVYIPYFVAVGEVSPHFCVLPGTILADRVIVQDEAVRDTYIKEYDKYAEENNCVDLFGKGKNKFIALGSPKLDKVRNTMTKDIIIPDEWTAMLYGKDGNRKKVVFYNVTLGAFLKNGEKMLQKIEQVLEQFHMNSNILLLWRPHPLLQVTGECMRPELAGKYREIVKRYKEEKWGIFDDTPDLERAILWSDAYYGDWSSVVELYKETGKPIMIQKPDIVKHKC